MAQEENVNEEQAAEFTRLRQVARVAAGQMMIRIEVVIDAHRFLARVLNVRGGNREPIRRATSLRARGHG